MAILQIVSYDLRAPGRNYEALYTAIKAYSVWAKVLKSVWILETQQTSVQIRDNLKRHIDVNDKLFVVKMADWASQDPMLQDVKDWLAARPVNCNCF
jgi:hypothetical protein